MIRNTLKTIGLAVLLAFSIPVAAAPFIVQPVEATASSVFGVTTQPVNTINGDGLADLYWTLPTGAALPAQWPGHIAFNNGVNWHAAAAPASPVTITFDLGASYHLTGMHLWNMNQDYLGGRSIKTATISVSSEGTHFTDVSVGGRDNDGYFIPAPGSPGYRGEDYTFAGTGRFVRFSITINWYDTLDYVGISEVRFIGTAASPAVNLTNNTAISPGDTTYEGANLIVSNCTLTVDGVHSFEALLLMDGAVLTHSPAPAGELDNRLDLTITNNLTVDATSRVDVNGKGYGPATGPGAGMDNNFNPSGGGHGGLGGDGYYQAGGVSYGELLDPILCGSGGGNGSGHNPTNGGAGGGVIRLDVGGVLTVAGQLTADGESRLASGGAGGSIHVTAGTLAGNGSITANGGSAGYHLSGAGGGGRVALYFGSSTFSGGLTALGGFSTGANSGGAGTLYTKANSQSVGDLLLDNTGRTNAMETPITTPVAYRLTLTNVTAYATNSLTLTALRVSTNGLLTHPFQGPRLQVLVQGNAVVEAGGAIGADKRGYPLKTGPGAGAGSGGMWGQPGSGAGHGGPGGAAWYTAGGLTYGSATEPVDFGSGGGGNNEAGPNRGGGAIQLTVTGTLALNGRISANADAATASYDGGGSGGSTWLTASRLTGTGSITANGQVAGYGGSGSGGGGRIAIYTGVNEFAGAVAASGGSISGGGSPGADGSRYYGTNVPTGLISWWRGEGDASDTMGVHPGTAQGGLGYAAGQVGQAFVLNGQDAAVALGNWFNLQEFTLSLWVKPGATQVPAADLLDNNHPHINTSWFLQSADNSVATASQWMWGGNGAGAIYCWMTNSAWQQLVVTVSSNHVSRLYLNGLLIETVTGTGPIVYDGTEYFNLGKHHLLGRYYNGLVDELMCFGRALDPGEVASLYFNQGGPLQLSIQSATGGVQLSWPASAEGFGLVSRSNLTAGTWESVTNAPSLNGDRKEVLLPVATPVQRFFRLQNGH